MSKMSGQIAKYSNDKKWYMECENDHYYFCNVLHEEPEYVYTPQNNLLETSSFVLAKRILKELEEGCLNAPNSKSIISWHCILLDELSEKEGNEIVELFEKNIFSKKDWTYDIVPEEIFGNWQDRGPFIYEWLANCTTMQLAAIFKFANMFDSINLAYVLAILMEEHRCDKEELKIQLKKIARYIDRCVLFPLNEILAYFDLFCFYYGIHLVEFGNIIYKTENFQEDEEQEDVQIDNEDDEVDCVAINNQNGCILDFPEWLIQENFSKEECKEYYSILKSIDFQAIRIRKSASNLLASNSAEECFSVVKDLYQSVEFITANKEQLGQYDFILTLFLKYKGMNNPGDEIRKFCFNNPINLCKNNPVEINETLEEVVNEELDDCDAEEEKDFKKIFREWLIQEEFTSQAIQSYFEILRKIDNHAIQIRKSHTNFLGATSVKECLEIAKDLYHSEIFISLIENNNYVYDEAIALFLKCIHCPLHEKELQHLVLTEEKYQNIKAKMCHTCDRNYQDKFCAWLEANYPDIDIKKISEAVLKINYYLFSKKNEKKPLFEIYDQTLLEEISNIVFENKVFRESNIDKLSHIEKAINLYIEFLKTNKLMFNQQISEDVTDVVIKSKNKGSFDDKEDSFIAVDEKIDCWVTKSNFDSIETDSCFSVFSNFDFTYSVLKKLYTDNFEFDVDAKELQTLQWCQHNLNLRLPLLRKLRAFESAEDYRETFALLEGSSEWMICQLQDNLNRSGFLTWASENGFALSDIAEMLEVKIASEQDAVPETQDVQSEDLKRNSISDAELLIGAVSSLYKRQLLTGHLFSDFQAIYYCLQNFGITKPIICRHYPYMREEDFGKDYQFWADGPQELPYLILHNCSGLKHEKLLSFVQDLGLPLEELANDLNCELSFFETTSASPSEPEEQEVILDEQDQDEPVIQTFISNDEIDRMLLEFVTNTPGQKRDVIINHLVEKEIPEQRAATRLRRHSKVFCIADQYYSAEGIYGFDEAADVIWESLNDLFEQNNGYTSAKELYRAVSGKLDDFFYDNDAFDSEVEIYQLAQYLFEKEQYQENTFVFLNKIHIWRERPDYPTGDSGLLIHWAKGNKGLLTTNIAYANFLRRGVAEGSKTACFSLAMDKVYDRFWMIDASTFLLKDDIQITESQLKEIKVALDNLYDAFDYNFIPMWDIAEDWFDSLPRIITGQSWTPMLLQSVLRDYSEQLQYRTIPRIEHRQQHAAVVEVNSVSKDYSDLVYNALKAEFKTPSIRISRNDLFDLLIRIGLWPEDVSPSYGSAFQNLFKDNFHFHVPDKNTVEVG